MNLLSNLTITTWLRVGNNCGHCHMKPTLRNSGLPCLCLTFSLTPLSASGLLPLWTLWFYNNITLFPLLLQTNKNFLESILGIKQLMLLSFFGKTVSATIVLQIKITVCTLTFLKRTFSRQWFWCTTWLDLNGSLLGSIWILNIWIHKSKACINRLGPYLKPRPCLTCRLGLWKTKWSCDL